MKSIIETASTVAKAVTSGWERAGEPSEFSVKIFEKSVKGFLGFCKKPAKIALFYKEQSTKKSNIKLNLQNKPTESFKELTDRQAPLKEHAQKWVEQCIKLLSQNNKEKCSIALTNNRLTVTLSFAIYDDKKQEALFTKSFAHILLQVLRSKCKVNRRFNVIVLSPLFCKER